MCGIAGIVDGGRRPDPGMVERMLGVLSHRGPDGAGTWGEEGVVLGHRRLAIIDLSEDGAQPMLDSDGRSVITYNGEIYNYLELRAELEAAGMPFRSSSDTEVLLAAWHVWGERCLSRLNGMFAFAIYDRVEGTLFCARDRLGVKPLCYSWDGRRLAFASEVKALLASGVVSGACRPDAIYEYLARGYTSGGRSFYQGVEVLQPGTALALDADGTLRTWEWWKPDRSPDAAFGNAAAWADHVADLIDDAVRLRLRSDVPVGAHLSGGLDSSAIVAAAARHSGADVHTFTGAFPDDPAGDEREFARAVVDHCGVTGHEVEISVDELPAHFARILWHLDEPIAGEGVFPQMLVCDLARANGFIVVLGGQGGDEIFGGYLRHRALHYRRALGSGSPGRRAAALVELSRRAMGEWRRVLRTSTRVRDADLAPSFLAAIDPGLREEVRRSRLSFASARDLMWHDLRSYLPALLHVEDRTSMAASIESRTPLLDYRLVEAALRIPEDLLFAAGEPKPLLRAAVRSWLPSTVVDRRDKRGFPTPLHSWRDHPGLRSLVESLTTPTFGQGGEMWRVSSERDSRPTVFSDGYLARRDSFQPSELWTVLSVNGWLSRLEDGAFSRPLDRVA